MLYHGLVQRAVTRLVGFLRPAGSPPAGLNLLILHPVWSPVQEQSKLQKFYGRWVDLTCTAQPIVNRPL